MKTPTRILLLAAAALPLALNSCVIVAKADQPSTGRKLADLKTALDKGAIDAGEYRKMKARILEDG